MSSRTSLSDHCNSVPIYPSVIHCEPLPNMLFIRTVSSWSHCSGCSESECLRKKRPSVFIVNKQLAFETENLAVLTLLHSKMFDAGDLPALTFGNCVLKTGVIKWPLKLYVLF